MFMFVKVAMLVAVVGGLGGGVAYVYKVKADLATSEGNNAKLENSITEQKAVIEQQIKDIKVIQVAMREQEELNKKLDASINNLKNKFHKINSNELDFWSKKQRSFK